MIPNDNLSLSLSVDPILINSIIVLLRRIHKAVHTDKWEKVLQRFAHSYCHQDGWELERFGFKKAKLEVKIRVLKVSPINKFRIRILFL